MIAVGAGSALAVRARRWLHHAESQRRYREPFEGVLHRVGKVVIAERHSESPRATVIAMHGLVEDVRYFFGQYQDRTIQLIALTSCDYHPTVHSPDEREAPWGTPPTAPEGSIEYDAEVLVQALEHLPRSKRIRVHGHSRGGAVALEAARLRPDLFAEVEVILEAPVLPRARAYWLPGKAQLWFAALVVPLWKRLRVGAGKHPWYGLTHDARKRELLEAFPHNPKRVATLVANVEGIDRWMKERDHTIFQHVRRATVVIAGKDRILDSRAMRESARKAGAHVTVLEVEESSHFVSLDAPDQIPKL